MARRITIMIMILILAALSLLEIKQLSTLLPLLETGSNAVSNQENKERFFGRVIRQGDPDSNYLAYTCNVDWGEEVIPEMLDFFREKNIRITFFVSGRWAENHPTLLRKMYLMGHEIQNHGYSHKLCTQIDIETARQELQRTEDVIDQILGIRTSIFAPPSGDFDETTVELCKEMGYVLSLWSADTIDWRQGSTAAVIQERILNKPLQGAIILMHPKSETVKALPSLTYEIQKKGMEIVPLSELLEQVRDASFTDSL